ncbi:ankyrin repeat and KH domain-containing protein mask [Patella vulgata]|uniref:ankyrin repeat and KH domain-containing protein mask n=1 Tax=Patella vulgata TaxID=6465 RepID=UPI00217FAA08|nr:ankyrin repeat and KH domain-containing protein mask [Patella vulgata]
MDDTEAIFDALKHDDEATRLEALMKCINLNSNWKNSYDRDGISPLMSAAMSGFYECVSVMIEAGADVNDCASSSEETALLGCFENERNPNSENRLKCVRLLLDGGADIYQPDSFGVNPLMAACYICDPICLKEILKRGYERKLNQNITGNHKTEDETASGVFEDLSKCVEDDEDAPTSELSEHIDRTDINLSDGLECRNALHHCLNSDNTSGDQDACLQLLMDAGADTTIKEDSYRPLELAITSLPNSLSLVKILLAAGAPFDAQDFLVALKVLNIELVELFLEIGVDVNYGYKGGYTALMHLIDDIPRGLTRNIDRDERAKKCLKILFSARSDINLPNSRGLQPIHFAIVRWSFLKFPAEYLISENCDFSKLSYAHVSSVFYSAFRDHCKDEYLLDMIKFLYDCGLSYSLCQSFCAASSTVMNCVDTLTCSPRRLVTLSVIAMRQHLGSHIKAKCEELEIPKIVKNLILLKDVLSPECF